MKINKTYWLATDFQPHLLIWGCHEETRGTHWIEINSEGLVYISDYVPNNQGRTKRKETGSLVSRNFDSLLTLIRKILLDEVAFCLPASGTVFSLECVGKHATYQLMIPADKLKPKTTIQQVAEAFYTLIPT